MKDNLPKLIEMIKELMSRRFFGELVVRFRDGKIVMVKQEETIKLD